MNKGTVQGNLEKFLVSKKSQSYWWFCNQHPNPNELNRLCSSALWWCWKCSKDQIRRFSSIVTRLLLHSVTLMVQVLRRQHPLTSASTTMTIQSNHFCRHFPRENIGSDLLQICIICMAGLNTQCQRTVCTVSAVVILGRIRSGGRNVGQL